MRILGIVIHAGAVRLSLLDGSKQMPSLVDRKRLLVKDEENVSALMDWFESIFISEIERLKAEKIVCKVNLGVNKKQSITQIMPVGVLALCCKKKNIPFDLFTTRQFASSKLGLPKNTDLHAYCDTIFGKLTNYWDQNQKDSVIGAWMAL